VYTGSGNRPLHNTQSQLTQQSIDINTTLAHYYNHRRQRHHHRRRRRIK